MRRRHATWVPLAAVAIAYAGVPAPAPAAEVVGHDSGAVRHMGLTGERVVWVSEPLFEVASGLDEHKLSRLFVGRSGRSVRPVGAVGSTGSGDDYYASTGVTTLSVSGTHAAYTTESVDSVAQKYTGSGLVAASASVIHLGTGTRTRVVRCGPGGGVSSALSWPWLVGTGCYTGPGRGVVRARDLSTPGRAPLRLAESGGAVRAAGTMAGWITAEELVVRDLANGIYVQRIPRSALPPSPDDWVLQADGKVAIAIEAPNQPVGVAGAADRIAVAVPGVAGFTVSRPGGVFLDLHMAGDRFAFQRPGARHELVVRTLAGREHVLARFAGSTNSSAAAGMAFDGKRAAWARERCGRREIVLALSDGPTDDHRVTACAFVLSRYRARVTTRGRLRVRGLCPTLSPSSRADKCRVVATLFAKGRRVSTIRRRLGTGTSSRLQFPASRRLLRLRPPKFVLRVRTTMRGGTRTTRRIVRPAYPKRR